MSSGRQSITSGSISTPSELMAPAWGVTAPTLSTRSNQLVHIVASRPMPATWRPRRTNPRAVRPRHGAASLRTRPIPSHRALARASQVLAGQSGFPRRAGAVSPQVFGSREPGRTQADDRTVARRQRRRGPDVVLVQAGRAPPERDGGDTWPPRWAAPKRQTSRRSIAAGCFVAVREQARFVDRRRRMESAAGQPCSGRPTQVRASSPPSFRCDIPRRDASAAGGCGSLNQLDPVAGRIERDTDDDAGIPEWTRVALERAPRRLDRGDRRVHVGDIQDHVRR